MNGYHVKRGAYAGGPTWQLWYEGIDTCDIVFEAADRVVSEIAREQRITRESAFRLLLSMQRRRPPSISFSCAVEHQLAP